MLTSAFDSEVSYLHEKLPQSILIYPGLPPVLYMLKVTLEVYLYYWTYMKHMGILTCEDKITFYGASESWPVFRIEMKGILIKHGLLQLLSFAYVGGSGVTPLHLYFQSAWLGAVINMAFNNSSLRWAMHEGNKDGVDLWSWIKVRY